MAESRNQVTNGSDEQIERRRSGNASRESLADRGRQLQGDAQKLVGHVQEARSELQTFLTDSVRDRPVATLAAAAGVGYVLGGGLSSRLTVLMFGVATRFALAVAAREMGTWAAAGKMGEAPTPTRH